MQENLSLFKDLDAEKILPTEEKKKEKSCSPKKENNENLSLFKDFDAEKVLSTEEKEEKNNENLVEDKEGEKLINDIFGDRDNFKMFVKQAIKGEEEGQYKKGSNGFLVAVFQTREYLNKSVLLCYKKEELWKAINFMIKEIEKESKE